MSVHAEVEMGLSLCTCRASTYRDWSLFSIHFFTPRFLQVEERRLSCSCWLGGALMRRVSMLGGKYLRACNDAKNKKSMHRRLWSL